MSYIINKSDGSALVTPTMPSGALLDGTADTTTGLTLIGRNYTGFGEVQNENFVRLLENFAASIPPNSSVTAILPLTGTLWWDTGTNLLKVYNGATFIQVNGRIVANAAPTATNIGDQWWDTTNTQLKTWTGSTWFTIGPATPASQGKSGAIVETILDTSSVLHLVVNHYKNGNLMSITSNTTFTMADAINGFGNISKGVNIPSYSIFNGTATNSVTVGNLVPTVFARQDINQTFAQDVAVTGNLVLTNANIRFTNNSLVLQNKYLSGNIETYVNLPITGNTKALVIDGSSGLLYVAGDPISTKGVATKGYVDTTLSSTLTAIGVSTDQLETSVDQLRQDYFANITVVVASTNANLDAVHSAINANVTSVSSNLTTVNNTLTANVAGIVANIGVLAHSLPLLAPINNPTFTGVVQVPALTPQSNNSLAASSQYVDTRAYIMQQDYQTQLDTNKAEAATNLLNATTIKANIAGPEFTLAGNVYPRSVTPDANDNSTKIATTGFVTSAIAGKQFNFTVATGLPGNVSSVISSTNNAAGDDGDFWFTIG